MTENLAETQAKARDRLQSAKERSKRYYDQKLNQQTFALGDPVYLQNNSKSSKLDPDFSGPFIVTDIPNDYNVEIDLGRGKSKVVHINRLRSQTVKIFPDRMDES